MGRRHDEVRGLEVTDVELLDVDGAPRSSGFSDEAAGTRARPPWHRRAAVHVASAFALGLVIGMASGSSTVRDAVAERDAAGARADAAEQRADEAEQRALTVGAVLADVQHFAGRGSRGPATAAVPGDGVWVVGVEISPGQYATSGGKGCHWARYYGSSRGLAGITANGSGGEQTVTIEPSDVAFETRGCGRWDRAG